MRFYFMIKMGSMKLMSTFSMRAETTGKGDFVVLVLGGLTGWLTMIPHAEQLAKNYRVVRVQPLNVDLGIRNEPLQEDYSVDYETKALAQTVKQNNIIQALTILGGLMEERSP